MLDNINHIATAFGFVATLSAVVQHEEIQHLPVWSPISIKSGTKATISQSFGNNKPITAYAECNIPNIIKSSTAGIKLNISKITITISLGFDDIGIYGSYNTDNSVSSFGVRLNISELKIGFEQSFTIHENNIAQTTYTNSSINGGILFLIYAVATGIPAGFSGYAFAPA